MIGRNFLDVIVKERRVKIRICSVCIQNRLPLTVLISPLWAITRKGCARSHEGNVFVLKRECTRAIALPVRGPGIGERSRATVPT